MAVFFFLSFTMFYAIFLTLPFLVLGTQIVTMWSIWLLNIITFCTGLHPYNNSSNSLGGEESQYPGWCKHSEFLQ